MENLDRSSIVTFVQFFEMEDSCIIVIDFSGNIFLYQRKAHAIEWETASISSIYTENFLPGGWDVFSFSRGKGTKPSCSALLWEKAPGVAPGESGARIEMWAPWMVTEGPWNEGKIHAWSGKRGTSDWESCSGRSGVRKEILALVLFAYVDLKYTEGSSGKQRGRRELSE